MKSLKILCLFIVLCFAFFPNTYATETETDISDNLDSLSSMFSENAATTSNEGNQSQAISISNSSASSHVVKSSNSSTKDSLSISDIINIILIAVGLVLIFLGIAILLKIK